MPTIEPPVTWVVETGKPKFAKPETSNEIVKFADKPVLLSMGVIFSAKVLVTRRPPMRLPMPIANVTAAKITGWDNEL